MKELTATRTLDDGRTITLRTHVPDDADETIERAEMEAILDKQANPSRRVSPFVEELLCEERLKTLKEQRTTIQHLGPSSRTVLKPGVYEVQ